MADALAQAVDRAFLGFAQVGFELGDELLEKMVAETEQRFGPPAILLNNAGVIEPIGPLASSDPAAWRRNIEVNLIGAYNGSVPRCLECLMRTAAPSLTCPPAPLIGRWKVGRRTARGRRAWRC